MMNSEKSVSLKSLRLSHFRNWEEGHFVFNPKINFFTGPNGHGKTAILEALYLLVLGRSFRTYQLQELIQKGTDSLFLEAEMVRDGIETRLRYAFDGKQRKLFCNQTEYSSLTEWIGLLPGLVITPDDQLVKGTPQQRRQFIDLLIAQEDSYYLHCLARYYRAMRQRNALLKKQETKTLETWEQEMAQAGAYLICKRQETIEDLKTLSQTIFSALNPEEIQSLDLRYDTKVQEKNERAKVVEEILSHFNHYRTRELILGCTLWGPHRDDLIIQIQALEARSYASEGQKRTLVNALRFGAWERLKKRLNTSPLMLIDDIGIGLDPQRQERLANYIQGMGQVFITGTQDLNLQNSFNTFHVFSGKNLITPVVSSQ